MGGVRVSPSDTIIGAVSSFLDPLMISNLFRLELKCCETMITDDAAIANLHRGRSSEHHGLHFPNGHSC